ncbi:serine hydrolase [Larkinella insperata]|uniref:Serine hydrolase n=1 Tax=Larkinella insperata TaxID=332158 RepID=A0ABW3Q3Y1_9BACT
MKKNRLGLLWTGCLLFMTNAALVAQSNSDSTRKQIKQMVMSRIDNNVSVGTVVAFLEDGKEEYFVYGLANITDKQPITKKSVFDIGSITKTFTSLLLADLVLKGSMKLDDPVQKFLPDSVKMPAFNGRSITLLDLATHTSGLPRMPSNFKPRNPQNPFADYAAKDLYAFLKTVQLNRPTGTFEYSNLGVGLLGHLLTLVTGKSYELLLQETILKPLKMKESSTFNSSPYLTVGHVDNHPVTHWDMDIFAGAGAIRSNAENMMRYVKAEMGLLPSPLKEAMTFTQQPRHEMERTEQIGLGWLIRTLNQDEIMWHNGATAGYTSFVGFSRKTNKAIIILNNSQQSVDELGMHFFDPSVKITPTPKAIAVPVPTLQRYVGVYEIQPGQEFDVKLEGDQLLIKLGQQSYMKAYAESENKFFSRVVQASVAFFNNEKGEVDRLVLYQNGQEISAKRK